MDITPLIPKGLNIINSYGPKGFEINKFYYKETIILTPNSLMEVEVNSLEELFRQDLAELLQLEAMPEIFIIGTGSSHIKLSSDLKEAIKNLYPATSINEMASRPACSTYNFLMSEGRSVAAILRPIDSYS